MDNNEITKSLFNKDVCCPICSSNFSVKAVKVNAPRISSRDSDLFIRYSGVNPYFYDVWICNKCGYSAMKSDFFKVTNHEKELITKNITSKWKPKNFPEIIDAKIAIDRYKLALITATFAEKKNSTKAFLLLKIAWMHRLLNDKDTELSFIKRSLECFLEAYSRENFPIYGLQRDSLTYLIGDLFRKSGNNSDALSWYSKVITTVGTSQRIKELARNGRDIIKGDI